MRLWRASNVGAEASLPGVTAFVTRHSSLNTGGSSQPAIKFALASAKLTFHVSYRCHTVAHAEMEESTMIAMTEAPMEGRPAEAAAELLWDPSAITMAFLNIPPDEYSEELERELLAVFRRQPAAEEL
jgi:hypothetical protein